MIRKAVSSVSLFFALLIPAAAHAHGDMDHILGTVVKISGDVVTVTKDGKESEVYLRHFTKYELAGQVSARTELHIGDRVVIHAKKNKDNKEEAYDVRLMHPPKN